RRGPRRARCAWATEASSWGRRRTPGRSCAASLLLLRLQRLLARRRGSVRLAHCDAIGHAQVDERDVARQQLLVAIERDQAVERLRHAVLRQLDVDAVLEPQIPAP